MRRGPADYCADDGERARPGRPSRSVESRADLIHPAPTVRCEGRVGRGVGALWKQGGRTGPKSNSAEPGRERTGPSPFPRPVSVHPSKRRLLVYQRPDSRQRASSVFLCRKTSRPTADSLRRTAFAVGRWPTLRPCLFPFPCPHPHPRAAAPKTRHLRPGSPLPSAAEDEAGGRRRPRPPAGSPESTCC